MFETGMTNNLLKNLLNTYKMLKKSFIYKTVNKIWNEANCDGNKK